MQKFAILGERPLCSEQHGAFYLALDLPAFETSFRDGQGRSAQSGLVTAVSHDGVRLVGAEREGVSVCACCLNFHFVVELALRRIHFPESYKRIARRPYGVRQKNNCRQMTDMSHHLPSLQK